MNPSTIRRPGPDAEHRPGMIRRGLGLALKTIVIVLFAGIPLAFVVFTGKEIHDGIAARFWQPVAAQLESVELKRRQDSDGQTVWQVRAGYRYRFDGREYRSDRVSLHYGADNLGDYHQRVYARLDAARRAGKSVTAWVDPDQPSRAVLDRELRWGRLALLLLFPLVFGGAAVLLVVRGRRQRRRQQERERMAALEPERPWLQHERWRSTTLSSEGRATMWLAIGFAALWNLVSLPLLFVLPGELEKGNWPALLGLLFPLIGIGLIAWAVREGIRARRYGESTLELDALPVALGGRLGATLSIPARLQGRELNVQVACLHRYRTGTGKNRRTVERTLWEDRVRVTSGSGRAPGQTSARIEMRLPGDQPPAREDDADDRIVWQLEATSEEPGVDYKAVFGLPVFEVAAGGHDPLAGSEAQITGDPAPHDHDDWRETGVEHGYVAGGQRFHFPRGRLLGAGLGTLVFALVFLGTGIGLGAGAGHWWFGGVFALFGLLILWGAATMLFSQSEIVIGNDRLRWRHGVFGRWREVEAGAIKTIDIKRSGSIGRKLYFRIEINRWGETRKTAIADWVPNERAARSLAAHLASLAGKRSVQPG